MVRITRGESRGGGFSRSELLAVIAVVALNAGTAIVALGSGTGDRSAAAARQLQSDMTFARERAMATGRRSWVEFDAAAQRWTLRAEDPASPGRTPGGVPCPVLEGPGSGERFVQALDTGAFIGVTMSGVTVDGEDWIGFDWQGRPLRKSTEATPLAADAVIRFSGGHRVTVNKDTGNVVFAP